MEMKVIIAVSMLLLVGACSNAPSKEVIFTITEAELAQIKLVYYSDYFSFVGWDEEGAVAFAIDNNRGQDQDTWQADHFVALYDEHGGWQAVQGNGLYDNPQGKLTTIPDSEFFSFHGTPQQGMVIHSTVNGLKFQLAPINIVLRQQKGLSEYSVGSAPATLQWHGRTIKGRVIHEYLFLPAFNRLTRRYVGAFDDFHGIYGVVKGHGDFYYHNQRSDFFAPLIGKQSGFLVWAGQSQPLTQMDIEVTRGTFALGMYRWPRQWQGSFQAGDKDYQVNLELSRKNAIANWLIGGFAMGVVTGELRTAGEVLPVLGLGELIP